MSRPEVAESLSQMGIDLFIPISNLTAGSQNGSFFIPILTAEVLRRGQQPTSNGGAMPPSNFVSQMSGVMNLGLPRTTGSAAASAATATNPAQPSPGSNHPNNVSFK